MDPKQHDDEDHSNMLSLSLAYDTSSDDDAEISEYDEDTIESDNDVSDPEEDFSDPDDGVSDPSQQLTYTVLLDVDILKRQDECIDTVSKVLCIPKDAARILLLGHSWNPDQVQEAWFSDESCLPKSVGLSLSTDEPKVVLEPELTCGICFDDCMPTPHAPACCHPFCTMCWKSYITTSIEVGPECLKLRCPEPSCKVVVTQEMIESLVPGDYFDKYKKYLLGYYTECNRKTKRCPASGCEYTIERHCVNDVGGKYDVWCLCSHKFCWNCLKEAHSPLDCARVSKWMSKDNMESANVNWIIVNTKPCPNCGKRIQKDSGCNHIKCKPPCDYEFCWICLGDWPSHKNEYYFCNRRNPAQNDNKLTNAKKFIRRYTQCYEGWTNNHSSQKQAQEDLNNSVPLAIEKISKRLSQPLLTFKFIKEAWEQIVECRRVLKWTHAYGHYIPERHAKKILFEGWQGEAEALLRRLHRCAERDFNGYMYDEEDDDEDSIYFDDFLVKLSKLTTVTRTYFEKLVKDLENGLADMYSQVNYKRTKLVQPKG